MEFVERILYAVVVVFIAFFLLRKWIVKSEKKLNSKFFKYIIVLLLFAIGFEFLIDWVDAEPEIVRQTVEQLKVDPAIKSEIGSFKGYGYNKNEIKKVNELPAMVSFSLFGNIAEIHLSVIIDTSANIFEVKEYQVDTLIRK